MRRHTAIAAALLPSAFCLLTCNQGPPPPPPLPVKEAIAVEYVQADKLPVHTTTSDSSPVITTFASGESVSILSQKDGWVEVRTADGSGWAHAGDVANETTKGAEADNDAPRFRRPPMPVSQPGAHGDITLEADVNSNGDVTAVRIIGNSTGSDALAANNAEALRAAHFVPIVKHGERKNFTYEHRIHY